MAFSIAESASASRSLVAIIERLEKQKEDIERQIEEAERLSKVVEVTEDDIRYHYQRARELFNSGQLPEVRQLINLYLERVVVYKEHVEIFIHVLPLFCGVNHDSFENRFKDKMAIPSIQEIGTTRRLLIDNCR